MILLSLHVVIILFSFGQQNSLLWEISKEGYETSYLFGTIHLNHKEVLANDSMVLHYLQSSDAYAGEIIFSENDMLGMMGYIFEKDINKQCGLLLNDKEMIMVKKAIRERIGPELELFVPMLSPYIVATLLAFPPDLDATDEAVFLDMYLQHYADSLGLSLISLESIESQMAYLTNIPAERQKQHLLKVINELNDSTENSMDELIEVYKNGDLKKIEELVIEYADEDPIMDNNFMEERNAIHTKGMMEAMKTQGTFTAVGAAHLPGKNGIIKLLKTEGFQVRALVY